MSAVSSWPGSIKSVASACHVEATTHVSPRQAGSGSIIAPNRTASPFRLCACLY